MRFLATQREYFSFVGRAIHSLTSPRDIASAVRKAESLRSRLQGWPPINSGQDTSQGLGQVMADEMGFID